MPQTIQGGTNVGTSGNDNLRTLYYDSATETTTIYSALVGLGGDDALDNNGGVLDNNSGVDNVTLDGGADNDRIYNTLSGGGQSPSIVGGAGNDYIHNGYSTDRLKANNATIDAGAGADTVNNYGDNPSITLGDDDDSAYSVGDKATITGGNGGDRIYSYGDDSSIDGGAGNDYLVGEGDNVTVRGGDGNDTLYGENGSKILLDATSGNNYFNVYSVTNSTIQAGSGNDTVSSEHNQKLLINLGAGVNSITDRYDSEVTIQALGGNDSITLYDSSNISIDAGDGANYIDIDNLNDSTAAGYTINAGTGNDTVHVYRGHRALISTGGGDDSINNVGHNSTINGGDGDDWINNHGGGRDYDVNSTMSSNNLIDGGKGNDSITNGCDKVTINGGDNDDYISSAGVDKVLINGGDGNDTIENIGNINREVSTNSTLNGGAGDDYIYNLGNKVTITAGTGNDTVLLATGRDVAKQDTGSENVLINYSSGDGNDLIQYFSENSTLSIGGGNYSSAVSGSDVVLTVGTDSITLAGAATLDTLNIVGTLSGGDTTSGGDVEVATSLVGAMLYRTEKGYPYIAEIAFNPTVYHGDEPTNYASKETWTITSSDGLELEGYHYTPENSNDKWVVIIHGYGHNHKHMYPFAGFYLANGYNVLMVDQRSAGESEGSWLTMGTAESADIALWTQEIARRNSDAKITLFGVSMGAATAMLAASRSDIKNVTSLVEDCGYSNVVDIINLFNSIIFQEDQETIDLMMPISESLTGYNLKDAAPIDYISKAKMPTLFITGSEDSVVAGSMLPALYNASGATVKEQFIVQGAGHGVAGMYDPVGYSNTTFRFLAEANGEGWATENAVDGISLRGTKYADTISNSGDNVTINTAAGNDQISLSADAQNVLILYASGDGNDFIAGFDGNDTMSIAGGKYSSAVSGDDVVLTVGRGKVTLSDAADLSTLNIVGGSDTTPANKGIYVANSVSNTLITGTAYNDTLYTSAGRVTINGLAGNDYIVNDVDSSVTTSAVANLIDAGAGNDTIYNHHSYQPTLLGGDGNDSIVVSRGHMTYIDGGAGNDSIIGRTIDTTDSSDWAMGGYATILGGGGNDYINPFYTNNSTIDGGSGNDTIIMMGADSTITGSTGNDQISLGTADSVNVWINYASGDGNDVINGFTENDTVSIGGAKYYSVASGNDLILTVGNGHMTLRGAATLEDINIIGSYDEAADSIISNSTNAASVIGTSGNDTITNTGARATIDALGGNDSITSSGSSVLLFGGAGNDSIYASGRNTTIDAGAGSNLVSVTGSQGLYVVFDGNTTVDGFNTGFGSGADTILINGDAPSVNFRTDGLTFYNGSQSVLLNGVTSTAKLHLYYADSSYSAEVFIADNDLYKVTDNDLRQNNLYFVGATASHNHGIDFSDITRSLNVTLDTDYGATPTFWVNNIYSIVGGAGNTTITGSDKSDIIVAGSGNTTITAGGGNDNIALNSSRAIVNYSSGDGNDFIAGFNANSTLRISGDSYSTVESGNNVIVSVGSGNVTLDGAASLDSLNIIGTVDGGGGSIDANTEVYGGGDQTIASYAGQPVVLITDYKGALFDGNNFVVYSSDGALTIQDVTDKVIDLRDSSGNETLKAYTASTAGVIDGRGLAGYEIISGAANGTDIIYAGDGGSMLWGGAGTAADALLGGEGVDTFIAGRNQGMDNIFSAGVEDIVNLNDASLSDIVATAEVEGNKILVGFNTGNVIAVQSADEISATFKLADGSTHTYNHTTKTWQSA